MKKRNLIIIVLLLFVITSISACKEEFKTELPNSNANDFHTFVSRFKEFSELENFWEDIKFNEKSNQATLKFDDQDSVACDEYVFLSTVTSDHNESKKDFTYTDYRSALGIEFLSKDKEHPFFASATFELTDKTSYDKNSLTYKFKKKLTTTEWNDVDNLDIGSSVSYSVYIYDIYENKDRIGSFSVTINLSDKDKIDEFSEEIFDLIKDNFYFLKN